MSLQNDAVRTMTSDATFTLIAQARAMRSAYVADLLRRAFRPLAAWIDRRRTLAAVEDLSPEMLKDIGLDAAALKSGILRRVEDERATGLTVPPTVGQVRRTNAAEPHLRPVTTAPAANTDVPHAA